MKTLVTGATGFIGTHLVKALVEKGRDVRCLVRKTSNTTYLKKLGVELVYGDLLDRDSLKGIVKGVNIVYHLAGEVYSKRTSDYYKVNVDGTKNLLEACLPEKIKKFIYLSSISAVGPNPKQGILLNEKSPCKPITPYGKSKFEAEKLLMEFFEKYRFPVVIIRAPTVYGPLGQPEMVTKIIRMIHKGHFLIVGSGKNLRSLCYVDNLIQGLTAVERISKSIGEIYFVSDEETYTYNEIFQIVAQQLGIGLKETHLPSWIGEICNFAFRSLSMLGFCPLPLYVVGSLVFDLACDIRKAKEQLNYKPRIDFKEGIERTIRYYLKKGAC